MLENIKAILRDECKLTHDRPVVVGVSGGPDSLCLMEAVRHAGYPVIVAHYNHQLREESGQDALMVEKTASRLMLACIVQSGDVRAYAAEQKLSIEEAARNLRYRFMFELAHERKAQAVAVGHTADDQVETVLMHFLRGSGLAGLKGMSYRSTIKTFDASIPVIRPLLDLRREDTTVFCAANGLRPHYDSSNDSLNFQRNRIRHLLIPTLETYNPKFRDAVLRMSHTLKGDHAFMVESLESAWRRTILDIHKDIIVFDLSLLEECAVGLQRNLIKQAMQILRPGIDLNFAALERASALIQAPVTTARVDLKSGLRMFREANRIYVCTNEAELPFNLWPQMPDDAPIAIQVPGYADLAGGWRLTCERWHIPALAREQSSKNHDPFQVWLDADTLSKNLTLRVKKQGDHFAPLGMDGHLQKLTDFFVNEKIPQRARERWPLLCDGDEIVWIPGYRPSHSRRMTDATKAMVYFSASHSRDKIVG